MNQGPQGDGYQGQRQQPRQAPPRKAGILVILTRIVRRFVVPIVALVVLFLIVSALVPSNAWKAVFLDDGSVFFGKASSRWLSGDVVMTRVYYVHSAEEIVRQAALTEAAAKPEINIIKLGSEIHGPTDKVRIKDGKILYIEELRANSTLVKAIEGREKAPQASE